ncbi:hypothetical protein C8F04DRAFT_1177811 [Mycena alexandri]|uniref:Uncharacterized protein n=1 Tax=Mycena alexandri TaxID=1745969 RepID=A0AAD6T7Z2_9AGAR|nr:hypothetical protein C8F04DRAFT_1177811 [Mycena alexandri]
MDYYPPETGVNTTNNYVLPTPGPFTDFNDPASYHMCTLASSSINSPKLMLGQLTKADAWAVDPDLDITPSSILSSATSSNTHIPHYLSPSSDRSTELSLTENPLTLFDSSRFVSGMAVLDVLREAGITEDEETAAKYIKAEELWRSLRNHSSAVVIVERLGLDPKRTASSVKFKGGLKLTLEHLVHDLGWSVRTFTRKSRAYSNSRRLATYSWSRLVPVVGSPEYLQYSLWQGLVAMFGAGGFADQPSAPRGDALADTLERHAAALTQNQLFNSLTKLATRLQPPNVV